MLSELFLLKNSAGMQAYALVLEQGDNASILLLDILTAKEKIKPCDLFSDDWLDKNCAEGFDYALKMSTTLSFGRRVCLLLQLLRRVVPSSAKSIDFIFDNIIS